MSADPRQQLARIVGTEEAVILLCRIGNSALIKRNDTAPAEWLPSAQVQPTPAEWQARKQALALTPTN